MSNTTPAPVPGPGSNRKRILLLTHRTPFPPDRGDRIRSWHLLKELALHHDICLACTSDEPVSDEQRQAMQQHCRHLAIEQVRPLSSKMHGLLGLVRGKAITPSTFFRPTLANTICRWHQVQPFDVVLTFCTGMIEYARLIVGARQILDLVDVDSVKWDSYAQTSRVPMRWVYAIESRRLREIEAGKHDQIDAMTVVSSREAKAYREHVGDNPNLHVVGNGVDIDYFHPMPDVSGEGEHHMVFVGVMNYKPNVDAVCWFAQNVLPKVRKLISNATLQIVGRSPAAPVVALAEQPGIKVTGGVPDVRAYLQEAAAVVAPLQIARGVQNKVLEAMSCQRAVICSPQAAEGIDATPGRHLLVAHHQSEWSRLLHDVMTNSDYRQKLAASARQHVKTHYNWNAQLAPMLQLIAPTDVSIRQAA